MEYLNLKEIKPLRSEILSELDHLFSTKIVVNKPNSLQWNFLKDCVNILFNSKLISQFNMLPNSQKAQIKFEAESKLKQYYLRPGKKINYVFKLIHRNNINNIFLEDADGYPNIGGYSVLIRDTSNEINHNHNLTEKDVKEYIERVVSEAVDTEFEAYKTLPQMIDNELLNNWFFPFGPAKKEIVNLLTRHIERGWTLNNLMNPSTKRILSIKVKDITKNEIFVSTTEYWYLRWWDSKKNTYAFPYRETNRQKYVLRKDNGIWKVYEVIRPSPRTSIPHRRRYL